MLDRLVSASNFKVFEVDERRGFLPPVDPLDRLPADFEAWEAIGANLPKLLISDQLRATLKRLDPLDSSSLASRPQLERAMLLLSYMGHAHVWGSAAPADRLPAGVAVPWHAIAGRLGRPPVLSYASYALHNWRRIDPHGPIALGNIALLQNFLAGQDEEWFVLVHVDIEAKAAAALTALGPAQEAVATDQPQELYRRMIQVAEALDAMYATLCRMPERCDPYIYYNRVRPYLYGWKDQPALPAGLVYEGAEAYGGTPQKFRGETGAQSSIIPSLDAALGIEHEPGPLRSYLEEMRDYMPPAHRSFVDALAAGPSIRQYLRQQGDSKLFEAYNACVEWIGRFRAKHLEYAANYIHQQAQRAAANPTSVGTGGTPFMPYLKKHLDETTAHRVD